MGQMGTNYLNCEKGLWSWLTTLGPKRIGILYMITVSIFFGGAASGEVTTTVDMIEKGKRIYELKCMFCHTVTGRQSAGPTFKGLFGSKRFFNDGTSAIADEDYIGTSIEFPDKQVVKGYFEGQMPAQQLTKQEIKQIIEYIKSLK